MIQFRTICCVLWMFFSLVCFSAQAQHIEKDSLRTGVSLRGKIFGFVIIEDWWITSITFGGEYRFAKYHSLGADYLFFKHRYEQEQYNDTTDRTKYVEFSEHNPRQALLLDYRFYIPPRWINAKKIVPYFNLFYAFGKARINHEAEWEFGAGDVVNQKERFYDIGVNLGIRICFDGRRWGLDIGMGAVSRHKKENVEYYVPGGPNRFVQNHQVMEEKFMMRMNLFCYLFAKTGNKITREH